MALIFLKQPPTQQGKEKRGSGLIHSSIFLPCFLVVPLSPGMHMLELKQLSCISDGNVLPASTCDGHSQRINTY